MLATKNGGVNLPYNDSDVICAIQLALKLSIKPGWHCFVSLRYVVNNNNATVCCQIGQQNTVDHLSSGRYTALAAAKSAAGFSSLEFNQRPMALCALFLRLRTTHIQIMVGCVGAPKGAPGSLIDRSANPAQFTTSCLAAACGDYANNQSEAAIMATTPTQTQPEVLLVEGRAVTTSLAVAAYFTKPHKDILTKISQLECSPEFIERNFSPSNYTDPTGRTLPCYEITRDGFAFLAMGYTGKLSQVLDHQSAGRYSPCAAAKSAAGIGVPVFVRAHNRASGFFVREALSHLSMVGRAGASKDAPGSLATGYANPVRLTTSVIGVSGGELTNLSQEAAYMATTPTKTQPVITIVDGRAVTTSIAIAEYFTKRHADVIRKIETLECSPEFTERNFAFSEYTDPTGRTLPCYEITRDGFAFLTMGFTGKRAAIFKEHYINAFNAMEAKLSAGAPAFPERIELLITLENGVIVDSRPVQKGEVVASLDTFIELTERRGYLVIHPDDLKSLSLGHKKREG
ncbi:Rha family transcriptional regulator [Serratia rhizosphaerae]